MTQYKNSFHNPLSKYSYENFEADPNAWWHKGYSIHHQFENEWHIVKDGVCVGMMGTKEACIKRIDTNNPKLKKPHW